VISTLDQASNSYAISGAVFKKEIEVLLPKRTRTLYFIAQPRPSAFEELNRLPEEGDFIFVEFKQNNKMCRTSEKF
jgi:hypothetical protein